MAASPYLATLAAPRSFPRNPRPGAPVWWPVSGSPQPVSSTEPPEGREPTDQSTSSGAGLVRLHHAPWCGSGQFTCQGAWMPTTEGLTSQVPGQREGCAAGHWDWSSALGRSC